MWEAGIHGASNVFLKRAFHDRIGVNKAIFCFCDDLFTTVYRLPWWHSWRNVLLPIFHQLHVRPESVVRCLLARLPPGAGIPVHHDTGRWCTRSHRVHIPVFTSAQSATAKENAQVQFSVGRHTSRMQPVAFTQGAAVELNNRAKHAVHNHWPQHRVHLIFDWVELDNSDTTIGVPWIKYVHVRPGDDLLQTRRSISLRRRGVPTGDRRSQTLTPSPCERVRPMSAPEIARRTVGIRHLAKECAGMRRARDFEIACQQFVSGEIGVDIFLRLLRQTFGDRIDEVMTQWGLPDLVHDAERAASLRRAYAHHDQAQGNGHEMVGRDGSAARRDLASPGASVPLHRAPPKTKTPRVVSPTFVVIGGQKCGTTSVYEYLNQHPDLVRCRAKEPHVFDWCWERVRAMPRRVRSAGRTWKDEIQLRYTSAFQAHKMLSAQAKTRFTGEATPSYLLGGATVARRLHTAAPGVKLIVCLRDPVDRAYSHYQMTSDESGTAMQKRRRGTVAGKCFTELANEDIALLANFTDVCDDRWRTDARFQDGYLGKMPMGHGSHSYVGRGVYAAQLRLWLRVFPRDRFLFLWTSSLRTAAGVQREMSKIFRFLGMPTCKITDTSRKNTRKYNPLASSERARLTAFYECHNKALFELMSSINY